MLQSAAPLFPVAGKEERPVYAALDLGTNNCRMLVASPVGSGFRIVDAFSRPTRLGEGLAQTGVLSIDAMERTVEALQICVGRMTRAKVTKARYITTEACRRAVNCDQFLGMVNERVGIQLEIISSQEEAQLALAGCTPLLSYHRPHALVFDIGGGSTELIWVRRHGNAPPIVEGFLSLPFGVVTLTEDASYSFDTPKNYDATVEKIVEMLHPFEHRHKIRRHIQVNRAQMLGTSGTVTTLGGIILDLPRYDRSRVDGMILEFDTILTACKTLVSVNHSQRAAHPCIGEERAGLILAGCAILQAICRTWPVGRLRVADRGVREGILLNMIRPGRVKTPLEKVQT